MDISVPEHTIFFSGYLDAVGRVYTNDKYLYVLSALLIPENSTLENELNITVVDTKEVDDMIGSFQRSVSEILNSDTRERLLFYLVDYFSWFSEFTDSCICKSCVLKGKDIPDKHIAYCLTVNDRYSIVIIMFIASKNTVST